MLPHIPQIPHQHIPRLLGNLPLLRCEFPASPVLPHNQQNIQQTSLAIKIQSL